MGVLYRSDIILDKNRCVRLKKRSTGLADISVACPKQVSDLLSDVFHTEGLFVEHAFLVATDGKYATHVFDVSTGTIDAAVMEPRDIFVRLLLAHAKAGILAHNHPSGRADPSTDDRKCTQRIAEAGMLMGIPIEDHVVLGGREYCSLREMGQYNPWWRAY